MKQLYLSILIILALGSTGYCQHEVILTNGDTIECRILRYDAHIMNFYFQRNGASVDTVISMNHVRQYRFNDVPSYAPKIEKSYSELTNHKGISIADSKEKKRFTRLEFGLDIGYSYITNKLEKSTPSYLVDYANQLRHGYHIHADFTGYVLKWLGFGLRYSFFKTDNEFEIDYGYGPSIFTYDHITSNFLGLAIKTRLNLKKDKVRFYAVLIPGITWFKDRSYYYGSFNIVGTAFTSLFGLGLDFKLAKHIYLNFEPNYVFAPLHDLSIKDHSTSYLNGPVPSSVGGMNISRFELSLGLKVTI